MSPLLEYWFPPDTERSGRGRGGWGGEQRNHCWCCRMWQYYSRERRVHRTRRGEKFKLYVHDNLSGYTLEFTFIPPPSIKGIGVTGRVFGGIVIFFGKSVVKGEKTCPFDVHFPLLFPLVLHGRGVGVVSVVSKKTWQAVHFSSLFCRHIRTTRLSTVHYLNLYL